MAGRASTNNGKLGEDIACRHLQALGYDIIARNYRGNSGEIDIICQKDQVIYFAEVKARKPNAWVTAAETITYDKRRRLKTAVLAWLVENNKVDADCSYLLIFIKLPTKTTLEQVEIIEDYL